MVTRRNIDSEQEKYVRNCAANPNPNPNTEIFL